MQFIDPPGYMSQMHYQEHIVKFLHANIWQVFDILIVDNWHKAQEKSVNTFLLAALFVEFVLCFSLEINLA